MPPLVVTLQLGQESANRFTALRRAHFPPERNWLDAHVTLFHALPGAALERVLADANDVAAGQAPFALRTERVLFLGAGVAFAFAPSEADAVRAGLARRWANLLGRQDSARRSALHVTVQNKVAPTVARALHDRLAAGFVAEDVPATGLDIWHYEGGPWRLAASCLFRGSLARPQEDAT